MSKRIFQPKSLFDLATNVVTSNVFNANVDDEFLAYLVEINDYYVNCGYFTLALEANGAVTRKLLEGRWSRLLKMLPIPAFIRGFYRN